MSVADATSAQFLDRASRKCTATVNVRGQSIWRRGPPMRPCTGRHSLGQSKVWRLGDFPEILAQHRGLTAVVGRSAFARRRFCASTGGRVGGVAAGFCGSLRAHALEKFGVPCRPRDCFGKFGAAASARKTDSMFYTYTSLRALGVAAIVFGGMRECGRLCVGWKSLARGPRHRLLSALAAPSNVRPCKDA